ncbi:MAG: pyrimidine 5'-nucleotidase [Kordiimonadales bacterium]|nr:MAG: pyrimidine 5'-nucleotidase [Kordiimonadales bacterium]
MLSSSVNTYHEALLETRDTWVFDLDNTLYGAECKLFDQIDRQIGSYVQSLLHIGPDEARTLQKRYLMECGTTLNGLMRFHEVDPQHYLATVHAIDFSAIEYDEKLVKALGALEGRKLVFTNADKPYATEIMRRLGILDFFEGIFDIVAADLQPKPKQIAYDMFVKKYDIDPKRAVMFEDMVRNLKPAYDMGMATVWVDTGSQWGKADHDPSFVHAETKRLNNWLYDFSHR